MDKLNYSNILPRLFHNQFVYPVLLIIVVVMGQGCAMQHTNSSDNIASDYNRRTPQISNQFTVPYYKAPPDSIQSLQLYSRRPGSPPIIELGGGQKLTLEFDNLSRKASTFTIKVSHRTPEWEESNISDTRFLSDQMSDMIVSGKVNQSAPPAYRHYSYTFPNDNFGVKISGNYFLELYDQYGDELIFRIPFFVHEGEGTLSSYIEVLYNQTASGRSLHQPFSTYEYGNLGVSNPEFYLSYYYVQNRFWGQAREVDILDRSRKSETSYRLSRERSFAGNIDFNLINLSSPDINDRNIRQIIPEITPSQILLRRDILGFDDNPEYVSFTGQGIPRSSSDAQYWDVRFRLDSGRQTNPDDEVYLVGDFNNWSIHKAYKMDFNRSKSFWEGNAFIKSGEYAYKYVTIQNNTINELQLDNAFSYSRNVYTTLVYFEDPNRYLYRLVNIEDFYSKQ